MKLITYEEIERGVEEARQRMAHWEAKLSELPPNRDGRRSPRARQIRFAIQEERRLIRTGDEILARLGKDVA